MNDHHEQLTAAVEECVNLLDVESEVGGILQAALAAHGYNHRTAVPGQPISVGICSACGDDVMRREGKGARCPCGATIVPETFVARMPGGNDAA